MKKTPKMLAIEHDAHDTLEGILPNMIQEHGMNTTAKILKVSRSALYIWIAKLGLEVNHQATVTSRQEREIT